MSGKKIDLAALAREPSEREKRKEAQREAQEEARKARIRASKRKNPPSLEDVLADIVRVAEVEETNPFHMTRSISPARYELYGRYPIELALQFGQFQHLKKMAGLIQADGTRLLLRARTERSLLEKDARFVSRYLAPHADKFPELRRATNEAKLAVFISDTHSLFMDPFTWLAFLAFIEDVQPDLVIWGGDHVDGSEITTHAKVPGHTTKLRIELACLPAMWREARARCPRSRFVWIESNHWGARIVRYLTQNAPAIADLPNLKIDQFLDMEGLDIEVVQPGSFLSPEGQEDKLPGIRLWDSFIATHGTKTGKHPAAGEILEWGQSGVSGHVHRAQIATGPNKAMRHCRWMSVGAGVIDGVARYYVKGAAPAWTRGFGVIEKGRKALQFTAADTTHGELMVNGFHYRQKGKLPEGVVPVRKFWMKRFGLEAA